MTLYYANYPKERTDRQSSRYRCRYCHLSENIINGKLNGHLKTCKWRMEKELEFQVSYYHYG